MKILAMFRWPWQQGMQTTRAFSSSNINQVKMAFKIFGATNNNNMPPLIIMHGLFGSKQNWRGIGKTLEKKLNRKIYTVDARNHGESPHTSTHGSREMASDVAEFIKQENMQKACVLGHCMGGKTMMYLALKYPKFVDRGIIVDASPIKLTGDFQHMEIIFAAMKNISVPKDLPMTEGRQVVAAQMEKVVGNKDTLHFIMLNLKKKGTGEYHWGMNVDVLHNNLRSSNEYQKYIEGLNPFQGPMSFICGIQSNHVDAENWPAIQKIFPNSEIHWLNAGHLVHYDETAEFIDLVSRFINK